MSNNRTPPEPFESHGDWLIGGGEMGKLIRSMDWSRSPLGPMESWPQGLRMAVRLVINSRFPMFVWWGEEFINIYNDAYIPVLGQRHPAALGMPAPKIWSEIWSTLGPQAQIVTREGRATWNEELLLTMERNEFLEETYFTFSYSPAHHDDGNVGGVFCACTEDTERVLGQRRLRTLRSTAEQTAQARTAEDACSTAAQAASENPHDLPFLLLYLLDGTDTAKLAGMTGLEQSSTASPPQIDLHDPHALWPLGQVNRTGQRVDVLNSIDRFGPLPGGAWPESPERAVVLPLANPAQNQLAGFMVAGISPRRPFDDGYSGFLDLLAGQIATSITSARAYEEERKRAEALAELDQAKTTFFSNVSHEFRTPLTLMLGPVEDTLSDPELPLTASQRNRLEVAHRNSLRLLKLVNSLLDFSRIEAGRIQAVYQPTDLAEFTAELASNFRSACEKAGLALTVNSSPLAQPVFVDRDMWEKIVLNLVSNAFKFTLEGEIEVTIKAIDGHAELIVRDTGTGIPEDEMPRLFERFHRIEGTRGRTQEGTGIGLALVQELVKLHGGQVRATSQPGEGTTLIVAVPFGKDHLPADRIGASSTLSSTSLGAAPFLEEALRWIPESRAGSPASEYTTAASLTSHHDSDSIQSGNDRPHILWADDNADMRDYVCRLLSQTYKVTAVPDGLMALEIARNDTPDLVLTDIMMPGLDGFELLRELRRDDRTQELPVIMLSARAGEEARVEGMEAGADDYLTKPFSARELLARVATHLQMARIRRAANESIRQSEERLRALVTASSDVIYRMNADWTEMRLLQGREFIADTDAHSRSWLEKFIHPDDQQHVAEVIQEAIRTRSDFELEHRIVRIDGTLGWTFSRAVPLLDGHGEIVEWIGAASDVTGRRQAEQALQELAAELSEANRRKDEFLATLAHELRNPLAPIRTGLEVMRLSQDDPETVAEIRGTMERQAEQLVRLIDDLLDVSRITRGKMELRKCRVDIGEVIQSAVEASKPFIDEAGHELTVNLEKQSIPIHADPHRLAQVVSNLLNNAARYTSEGGHIRLSVDRHGSDVVIAVIDNGRGIPAENLELIFEMFSQVDRSMEEGYTGLGIGLTLVKSLVELHDGHIDVRSGGEGHGSEFRVRLPIAVEEPDDQPVSLPTHQGNRARHKHRVLIVDDNDAAADMLGRVVRMLGHEVSRASDGQQGIEVAADFKPDVILMDLGMPKMNGLDAARHIRKQPWGKNTLLVALTGWGQDDDRRRTKDAGFDHHLVKPAEPAELRNLFANLTDPV